MKNQDPVGYLYVFVRTAGGSIPVENAAVRISREGEPDILLLTDRNGMTKTVALAAPPAVNSETADGGIPYYDYRVEVTRDGYYRQQTQNVPIFPGITARQPINLIGLSEFDSDTLSPTSDLFTVTEDPQSLRNGKENS